MKKLIFLPCLSLLLIIVACSKDDAPTAQEKATAMLISAAAWENPVVTVDGVDYTDLYSNFTLIFTKGAYTTTGGGPAWKASGVWEFIDTEVTLMKMDNDREVEINSISSDLFEFSFQWDESTFEPGRSNSVKGKQRFRLQRRP